MSSKLKISVVGLGKLGVPLTAVIASKGCDVVGIDVNETLVSDLNNGIIPFHEVGLDVLWNHVKNRIKVTNDVRAIVDTDITFIIVPTPSNEDGSFSLDFVLSVIKRIGEVVRDKNAYHLVVLKSTVMPGATGGLVRELLEKSSGKSCVNDIGLCYNPEFVALGSVINDMKHPDFVLIGECDEKSGKILSDFYSDFHMGVAIEKMNLVNAEITKLALNTYVTAKITFANVLSRVCERIPGGDVDVVTCALGRDSRIGKKYLKGAVAYGGPCFPRDNKALSVVCKNLGVVAKLPQCIDEENTAQTVQLVSKIRKFLLNGEKVGIVGISYKPHTDVLEESAGVALAKILSKETIVIVYDPVALNAAKSLLGDSVKYAASLKDCVEVCDVIVVMLPYDEFKQIPSLISSDARKVVIDCWRIVKQGNMIYEPIGCCGGVFG